MKRFLLILLFVVLIMACTSCSDIGEVLPARTNGDSASMHEDHFTVESLPYYVNHYNSAPDIPSAGTVKFTALANYYAATGTDGELYFLVGVTDAPESESVYGESTDLTAYSADNYMYNGMLAKEYLASLPYNSSWKTVEKATVMQTAPWELLREIMKSGIAYDEAIKDPKYIEISEQYEEYMKADFAVYASRISEMKKNCIFDHVIGASEYLQTFGIETVCDPYSYDWLYHLATVQELCQKLHYINGTMHLLVKCTKEELISLIEGNKEYGFIFYASDENGAYYVSSEEIDPNEYYKKRTYETVKYMCYYDSTLSDGHIKFTFGSD